MMGGERARHIAVSQRRRSEGGGDPFFLLSSRAPRALSLLYSLTLASSSDSLSVSLALAACDGGRGAV